MDIFAETLQVKDATRTRVQIGKDGTGDYALSQWDAQGNLMWDSRGAKAAAIKDKIIVNDMVSDNAGIEGKKINITSLVKEISDGTEVIKSSHIMVDGANQGKISTLITDVSQAKGDVSTLQTNYSSLTQTVNGINSKVSSHSTSIENLNSMEIGGRNLITNTRPDKAIVNGITSKWSAQLVAESTAISGKAMQATCTSAGAQGFYHGVLRKLDIEKKYTGAVYIKTSKNIRLQLGCEQGGKLHCDITTEWKRFTFATKYATGQTIPAWVKGKTYTVQQVSGSKALIKEITSWVKTSDLQVTGAATVIAVGKKSQGQKDGQDLRNRAKYSGVC